MCKPHGFEPIPRPPDSQRLDAAFQDAVNKVFSGESTLPSFVPASGDVFMDQEIEPIFLTAQGPRRAPSYDVSKYDRLSPEADSYDPEEDD